MKERTRQLLIHGTLLVFAFLTLVPFFFVLNNAFRTNQEFYRDFFGMPRALLYMVGVEETPPDRAARLADIAPEEPDRAPRRAGDDLLGYYADVALRGFRLGWGQVRRFMVTSLIVSSLSAVGVLILGSLTAYVLSRLRFFGHRFVFNSIIVTLMFPAVLTFVPSFMVVKHLGLLNTPWAMILPYIAGGQVFAIFVFKTFFDGLPEDLFESARIDGAGQFRIYLHLVLPLSGPVLAVVAIMNVLGTWNNFLWPFVTQSEGQYHVIASGLYVLATSQYGQSFSILYAAYVISSIPLFILFIYATRPFIRGVTSGAFKA